jgi:CheY-like chemotaxis protein
MTSAMAERGDLILVVDDDAQNLAMLAEVLSRHGFRVETASGADEAIRKVGWQEFAAVVSDIQWKSTASISRWDPGSRAVRI